MSASLFKSLGEALFFTIPVVAILCAIGIILSYAHRWIALKSVLRITKLLFLSILGVFALAIGGIYNKQILSTCSGLLEFTGKPMYLELWILCFWLFGSVSSILITVIKLQRSFAYVERHRRQAPKCLLACHEEMQVRIKTKAEIYCTKALVSPFSFGFRRFQIVIPYWAFNRNKPQRLEAILAHELAHVKARDSFWLVLIQLILALNFYNPLFYIWRRRVHLLTEMYADEVALGASQIDRSDYLELLLEVAGQSNGLSHHAEVRMYSGYTEMRKRFLKISSQKSRQSLQVGRLGAIILTVIIGTGVAQAFRQASMARNYELLICGPQASHPFIETYLKSPGIRTDH